MSEPDVPPLHEFLTHALMYLNKLGVNIQKRTQALVDKKINSNYLESVDNVRKVNEKISTICLLSKQSIDTLESRVNSRIRLFLDGQQIENELSEKRITVDTSESATLLPSKLETYQKECDTQRVSFGNSSISIPDKVDFKHYRKCKVLVTPYSTETDISKEKTIGHTEHCANQNKTSAGGTTGSDKQSQLSDIKKIEKKMKGWSSSYSITAHRKKNASGIKRKKIRRISSSSDSGDREPNLDENNISCTGSSGTSKRFKEKSINLNKSQNSSNDKENISSGGDLGFQTSEENRNCEQIPKPPLSGVAYDKIAHNSNGLNNIKNMLDNCTVENCLNSTERIPNNVEGETPADSNTVKASQKLNDTESKNEIDVSNSKLRFDQDGERSPEIIKEFSDQDAKLKSDAIETSQKSKNIFSKANVLNSKLLSDREGELSSEIEKESSCRNTRIDEVVENDENLVKKTKPADETVFNKQSQELAKDNSISNETVVQNIDSLSSDKVFGTEAHDAGQNDKISLGKLETKSNHKSDKKDGSSSSDDNDTSSFCNLNSDQDKNLIKSPVKGDLAETEIRDEDPETLDKKNMETAPQSPKPLIRCISINKLLAPKANALSDTDRGSNKIVKFNDTPIKIMYPEILNSSKGVENLIGCSPKPAIKPTDYVYKPNKIYSKKRFRNNPESKKSGDSKLVSRLDRIKNDITIGKVVAEVMIQHLLLNNLTNTLEDFHLDRIYDEHGQLMVTSKRLNESAKLAVLNSSDSSDPDIQKCDVSESLSNCDSQSLEVFSKKKKKKFSKKKRVRRLSDDSDSDDVSVRVGKRKKEQCGRGKFGEIRSDDHDDSGNSEMGRSLRLKGRGETSTANKERNKSDALSAEKSSDKSGKTEETLTDVMTNGAQEGLGDQQSDDDSSSGHQSDTGLKVSKMSVSFSKKPMTRIKSDLLQDSSSSNCETPPKLNGKSKIQPEITDEITIIDSDDEDPKESEKMDEDIGSESEISSKKRPKNINTGSIKSESESENSNNDEKSKKNKNAKVNGKRSLNSGDEDGSDSAKDKSEGSDSGESEIFQPTRRKRKQNKKSSGGESSDGSGNEGKSQAQKRRRIKHASGDESSGDGDSSGSEGGKRGRKNIRAVKRSSKLDDATRSAARQERERVQRISERQKLYNESMFDESGRPDEVVKLDKVVLDFDPETKEPTISVDRGLVHKLKPHQGNGIKFMWDACFESVKEIKNTKGSGCILAHCMGLGKTLQVVTLVHTLLLHKSVTKVERVLVVCPLSTVLNWVNEFTMWLEHAHSEDEVNIYELSRFKQNYERANQLKDWLDYGGVCVLGYEMFRNLSADNNKKFKKAQLATFQKALVDPGPDLVVCDEGHLLKNEKTSLSQSMNRVKTLRRIVLTGTPLQNNLKEYYCMVQFVKPNLLGKYNEYLNRFVNPITNGQYTDSTEQDIRVMKRRSHVLHKMLDGAVQRRDYAVLAPFLPPKHEYVLFISLTEIQIKLYSYYLENFSRRPHPDRKNTGFLFPDFQSLQRIWTHPLVLKANSERYELMQQKKRDKEEEDDDSEGSLADFIDDEDSTTTPDTSESEISDDEDTRRRGKKKKKKSGKQAQKTMHKRLTRASANTVDDDDDDIIEVKPEEPARIENPTEWWISLCSEEELNDIRHSNKLLLLLDILKMCDAIGDKLLVFSQSLYSLDLIEQFLAKIDDATQSDKKDDALGGHVGSWSQGLDYFRLDGSTSCENRSIWCKSFNREDNPRARLFLISTRAGGLGINLVAANRVVIFDMSWNPSHDVQSIFRVYRFGQKKPCYVYRFLALGTMEEKIYERQVTKQAISKRVIDEQQIDRHYAESDLAELYTFCPVPEGAREVPKLPRDRLFADLLRQHDKVIYKYHEHDSLLENKEEETLTEEERKAAWDDYENEKTRPPPQVFGGSFLANFQQQQQQQIAINALTSVLRQDYPGISDQNLASMIPLLLQQMHQTGDAPLMQKMMAAQNMITGGYKYPQTNMLLNPANLAAANNMGGVNRASAPSYQYSWQQQQQLQLQRLQQQQALQQANMNMKYYAGGLGSRDSMDMAALQQRQRALLLGAAGNSAAGAALPLALPRGRPKHNQPLPTGEVVDLDSE